MKLSPAAEESLARWHEMVASLDLSRLEEIVAPEAIFRSPVANKPYPGQAVLCVALRGAMKVFQDFVYHRTFVSGDRDVCLEFSARVGDKELAGVDLIKFDGNGKIVEFVVMVRPASGLQALGEAMFATAGPKIRELLQQA
jgi:hypothetical protein